VFRQGAAKPSQPAVLRHVHSAVWEKGDAFGLEETPLDSRAAEGIAWG